MSAGSSSTESDPTGLLYNSADPLNPENYRRAVNHYGIKSQQIKEWYGKTQMFQMDSAHLQTPEQSALAESLGRAQGRQSTDTGNLYGLQSLAQPSGPTLGGQ